MNVGNNVVGGYGKAVRINIDIAGTAKNVKGSKYSTTAGEGSVSVYKDDVCCVSVKTARNTEYSADDPSRG